MGRVDDKVAVVTGGAIGIGAACARLLAAEGAKTVVTDLLDEEGMRVVAEIREAGGEATYLHQDVTQEARWSEIFDATLAAYGKLDILVNNAGIAVQGSILALSLDDFKRQNAVNLEGVFMGLKFGIPVMAKSGGGSIINLSSVAGLQGSPGLSAYSMTKGGVRLLTKSVARECIQMGLDIRVNSVHPGIIDTAIWDKMGQTSEMAAKAEASAIATAVATATVPGGKLGQSEDIAKGVLFLASDDSSYMTGSELVIDHGMTC